MIKLLFVCTHNRCRSIISEAVARNILSDKFDIKSAGSSPSGEVHPLSLKYLSSAGYDVQGLKSQSWDEFEEWSPDVVVTVCDNAAGEACPLWLGGAQKVHWGLKDPSSMQGSPETIKAAFNFTIATLEVRCKRMLEADFQLVDMQSLDAVYPD